MKRIFNLVMIFKKKSSKNTNLMPIFQKMVLFFIKDHKVKP